MTDFPAIERLLEHAETYSRPYRVGQHQFKADVAAAWAEYEELRSRYKPRRGRFVMPSAAGDPGRKAGLDQERSGLREGVRDG